MRRAIVVLGLLTATGCGGEEAGAPGAPRTLTIYASLPMQGALRPNVVDSLRGAEMALDERGHRVAGARVKFVKLDDSLASTGTWDAGRVSANARRAIADPTAIAYIGEANSAATAVAMPITNEGGLLQVSAGSTYGGLTRPDAVGEGEPEKYSPTGKRTFARIIPADHIQARAAVRYLLELRARSVHVLHDREPYGRGLAEAVAREAERKGIEVTGNDAINVRAANFRGVADRVRRGRADAVFFGGSSQSQAAQVTRDVLSANPEAVLVSPDATGDSGFAKAVGRRLEDRVRITLPLLPPDALPAAGRDFLERFEKEHGKSPEPFAIYGYEVMSVVLDAIEAAGDRARPTAAGRAAVVRSFFETNNRWSALGWYSIDEYGDTTLTTYGGFAIRGGQLRFDRVLSR